MLYMTLDVGSRFLIQRLLEGAPIDIRVADLFSPIVLTRDPAVEQELEAPQSFNVVMTGIDYLYSAATSETTATVSLDSPELVTYQRAMIDKYKGVASLHEPLGDDAAPPFLTLCRGGSLSGNQRRWLSTMSTTLASQPPVVLCEPRVQLRAV